MQSLKKRKLKQKLLIKSRFYSDIKQACRKDTTIKSVLTLTTICLLSSNAFAESSRRKVKKRRTIKRSRKSANQTSTYGKLFFVEENKEKSGYSTKLGYGTIVDNNLIDSNNFSLALNKSFSPFFHMGAEVNKYNAKLSESGQTLSEEAANSKITQVVNIPEASAYLVIGTTPLYSNMNFFNNSYFKAQINLELGVGITKYKEHIENKTQTTSNFFEINTQTHFSETFFGQIGLRVTKDDLFGETTTGNNQLVFKLGMDL